MLRRTGLVTLIALSGCADLDFDTACSNDPQLCVDETSAETSSGDAQDEILADSAIDDSALESSTDTATDDTSVDSTIDETSVDSALVDADAETLADADTSPGDTLDASDAADASDAKPDSDAGSDAAVCTASAYSCAGAVLKQCNAMGTAYTNIVTCPSAATCDPALKRCTACTPSAYSCSGAARQQCDTFGATTSTVATCATPELCLGSVGATCKTPSCGVGEKRCGAHDLEVCNAGRTGWETSKVCAAGCAATACLDVVEITGGRGGAANHFCARISDGTVRCWGANIEGGVDGIGTVTTIRKPVAVGGIAGAVQIAASERGSGARFADGSVREWGRRSDYTSGPPTVVLGLTATSFAMGGQFGCAINTSGAVLCYGANGSNQLGDGSTTDRIPPTFSTTGVTGTTAVAAGSEGAIALIGTSSKAWGSNGGLAVSSSTTPIVSPTASYSGVTQISLGLSHSCARKSDGTVLCSGDNDSGQLGNGTNTPSTSPVVVTGLTGVIAVTTGVGHSCAVSTDGRVRCWGFNGSGQLGNGSKMDSKTAVVVAGITTAIQVAAASNTTCALLADHTVKCWGSNSYGALGADLDPATVADSSTPVAPIF